MVINTKAFIEEYLRIKTKDANIIPFKLNKPQLKLYNLLAKQFEEGRPQRVIILKARQMGFSTLAEAILFTRTALKENIRSGIITHKSDATTNLFNMSKLFLQKLPKQLAPSTLAFNAYELDFNNKQGTGLSSKIKCMTAGGDGIGRSDTFQNLHLSEVSSWPHIKEIMDGLLQAVPNKPSTLIIIESTAKGYDYFKELWDKAVNGESDFAPLFCAWWELDEYRLACPSDFEITEEEQEIKRLYNLDDEQLCWRRWCIRNNCGGDINTFKQEYPASPEEAFLATGDCIFDKDQIVKRIESLSQTLLTQKELRGEFVYDREFRTTKNSAGEVVAVEKFIKNIEFVKKENGFITIHTQPEVKLDSQNRVIAQRRYSIGGDTAELGDDYFTAKVVANDGQQTVATLRKQRIDEDLYAEQLYCLGKHYHDALIGIETNFSYASTKELVDLGYPNLYMRERIDKTNRERSSVFGFNTNKSTKNIILSSLVRDMREDFENEADISTLREMLTFVRKENGSQEAQEGYHDDLVMAKAIANFISKQQGDSNWISIDYKETRSKLEKFFAEDNENDEKEFIVEW